jgi:hypothetical protein
MVSWGSSLIGALVPTWRPGEFYISNKVCQCLKQQMKWEEKPYVGQQQSFVYQGQYYGDISWKLYP